MEKKNAKFRGFLIHNEQQLKKAENDWRDKHGTEVIPYAMGTGYAEIASKIIPDKNGEWKHPLLMIVSNHNSNIGAKRLATLGYAYYEKEKNYCDLDLLSITAGMDGQNLTLRALIRVYDKRPNVEGLYKFIGNENQNTVNTNTGALIIPEDIKNFKYSEEDIEEHRNKLKTQNEVFKNCNEEQPFLNQLKEYVPLELPNPQDTCELIYDLRTKDMNISTHSTYPDFIRMFQNVMNYANGIEFNQYVEVMRGNKTEQQFMELLESYVVSEFVEMGRFPEEDVPVLMKKLYRSLFELYVVQDLIDDPNVTDVKITSYDCIRARVKGKAYLSNVTFLDEDDYSRFVNGILIKNGIRTDVPTQTFTDTRDSNYILRFSISSEYINSVECPYLHIRKVSRKKLMSDELIKAGMMTEVIRDYLLDCGKNSRGVVFAGPPGSGKTVALNWFLEDAYEQSAEILVIQENDELFANRKGVMLQHVVNYPKHGELPCNLEDLGKMALVAGANVFIIGEVKGAEICSAITLSNSGCRTALTLHSQSSTETIDKMADLAMKGNATSIQEAKRSLKSFQTIVYLENFSVKEISEVTGYDDTTGNVTYKCIYRKPEK